MAPEPLQLLMRGLRRLNDGAGGGLSDAQLLERFVAQRDEAAFEVLVWRHGPTVLGVCRRLLADPGDVEDAFQATFLVLVRKAAAIAKRQAVASWLYKVAYNVALDVRRARARRRSEALIEDPPARLVNDDLVWRELQPVLDEAVMALPEKYRAAFVLCCVEGLTNEEAARQLGCARGTVDSRLARARSRLQARLTRRGITLTVGAVAALVAEQALAAVPATLVQHVVLLVRGTAAVSARVILFAEGALRIMFLTKMKIAGAAALTLAAVTTVGVLLVPGLAQDAGGAPGNDPPGAPVPAARSGAAPAAANDPRDAAPADAEAAKVRALRQSQDKLKAIGIALHNYVDTYKAFPGPAIYESDAAGGGGDPVAGGGGPGAIGDAGGGAPGAIGGAGGAGIAPGGGGGLAPNAGRARATGKALLSWRVAILPFLGAHDLYKKFKLNEPWDSPHNLKVAAEMPAVFAPVTPTKQKNVTYYQVFVGAGAMFEPRLRIRMADVVDGVSNTIAVVEAGEPVIWTKPEDLPFVPDQALPKLGGQFPGYFNALMGDGFVRLFSVDGDPETLRRAIQRDDGFPIDLEMLRRAATLRGPLDATVLRLDNETLQERLRQTKDRVAELRQQIKALRAAAPEPTHADPKIAELLGVNNRLRAALSDEQALLDALASEAARLQAVVKSSAPKE